jgi:hypothetical protein
MASLLLINYDLILKGDPVITQICIFGVCASIINSIIVFSYLGPFRDDSQPIHKKDWRRYFIMIYTLVNICLNLFSIIYDPKPYKIAIVSMFFIILYYLRGKKDEKHIDHKSNGRKFVWIHSLVSTIIIMVMLALIVYKKIRKKNK